MTDENEPQEPVAGDVPDPSEAEIVEAEIVDPGPRIELELPDDPGEALPILMSELMASRATADDATDKWKRAVAEFDNFRKRSIRDQEGLIARASERVVLQLLPVLDTLDAALTLTAESENESKMLSGMAGTMELLLTTLAREGLEPIEALGMPFDPESHEAVQVAEGSGTMVVETELRRGYTFKGTVLRASLVAVGYGTPDGSGSEEAAETGEE